MPAKVHIDDTEAIDYDAALKDADVVSQNRQWEQGIRFRHDLFQRRPVLERLVAYHVGLDPDVDGDRIRTSHPHMWRKGGFNVAIPMLIFDEACDAKDQMTLPPPKFKFPYEDGDEASGDFIPENCKRVILRCPIPSKCGEAHHPGATLEKLECEVAAYVWMQRNCPQIRIPHLYGFGLPSRDGDSPGPSKQFVHVSRASLLCRAVLRVRQFFAYLMGRSVPSDYVSVAVAGQPWLQDATGGAPLTTGYMVMECVSGPGIGYELPLVVRNKELALHPAKMRNLFRGVSRIILALARVPQPRIGAFRFNSCDGTIALDNRPITCDTFILESRMSDATPPQLPQTTYSSTDHFFSSLATFHDEQFVADPNAILSEDDCRRQMGTRAFLRSVAHQFIDESRRHGPFALYMSDKNAANMIVDKDWNVKAIYDLEWIISGPVDLPHLPSWLTWDAVDDIANESAEQDGRYAEYDEARKAFMAVFREEEEAADCAALEAALASAGSASTTLSDVMDETWTSKRIWFYKSILSIDAMVQIAEAQIVPAFYGSTELPYEQVCSMWAPQAEDIVKKKMDDLAAYRAQVARMFE